MNRLSRFALVGSALALAVAGPAFAHAKLVRSNPAANATVKSPRTITLTFNERLVPTFAKLELTMPAHGMTIPLTTAVSPDGKRLIGTPRSPLTKGSYKITWSAAGADGHPMKGEVAFKVG